MYSSIMAVVAAGIGTHSTVSLAIPMVIVLLAALYAVGHFIGREYVNRRSNRRNSR
jgi:sorbitol-specific phosphotransferase system component IIC